VVGIDAGSTDAVKEEEEEVRGKKKWKQGKRLVCFFQTLASNFSSLKL